MRFKIQLSQVSDVQNHGQKRHRKRQSQAVEDVLEGNNAVNKQ